MVFMGLGAEPLSVIFVKKDYANAKISQFVNKNWHAK
jgi:hypothetical protein